MRSVWMRFAWVLMLAMPTAAAYAQAGPDSAAMDWSRVPEYRIVPGDLLAMNFGPRPDAPMDMVREVRVRPDGRVSVFPVGDVVAAGLTIRALEAALVELLAADFKQPRVAIELKEVAGNQVHVLGQVDRPGSYPAGAFLTVSQAVAAAGGFKDNAARNSVLVLHRDGARTVSVMRVRVDQALKHADLSNDPPLSRFDIVYVQRSTVGNIEVFTRQIFGSAGTALGAGLVGWELFNVDRVYATRVVSTR